MTDQVEALERLAKLKANGVLTEEEFAAQKAKLLAGGDDVAAQPEQSFSDRWAEAREKSRGVRRFFHWFFGINALVVILVGTYFLTRLGTVETARQQAANQAASAPALDNDAASSSLDPGNAANQTEKAQSTAPTPQGPASETDAEKAALVVTSFNFEHPAVWDEAQNAWSPDSLPTPVTLCAGGNAAIGNDTTKPIAVEMVSTEGKDRTTIGRIDVDKAVGFATPSQGKWFITDAKDGTPLAQYVVETCPAGGGGQ